MHIHREKGTKTWWVDTDKVGEFLFTLDKKNVYNLFRDYPDKLSVEDWVTFSEDNPYWAKFFKDRNVDYITEHAEELYDSIGRERLEKIIDSMEVENAERT